MTTVSRTIQYALQGGFPAGTVAGKTRVILSFTDGTNSQTKEIEPADGATSASVDFEINLTGDYIITVVLLDINGNQLTQPIRRDLGRLEVDPGVTLLVPVDVVLAAFI